MKLNLYNDNELILSLNGKLDGNKAIFDNIIYDLDNKVFINEDETYKYIIDFNKNEAIVELKEYQKNLSLKVDDVVSKTFKDKHIIKYRIESEEGILKTIEVIF